MRTFVLVTALALEWYVVLVGDAAETAPRFNPRNATYNIGDEKVTLVDGKAVGKLAEPGSAMRTVTKIVGRPASGDLNRDGKVDAAVILMQDPGGSGTFYYIAAAVNVNGQAQGTNAILLGDRIALRTVRIISGQIIVSYADRKPSEPFAAKPTVPVTKRFVLQGQVLKEAAPLALFSPSLAELRRQLGYPAHPLQLALSFFDRGGSSCPRRGWIVAKPEVLVVRVVAKGVRYLLLTGCRES